MAKLSMKSGPRGRKSSVGAEGVGIGSKRETHAFDVDVETPKYKPSAERDAGVEEEGLDRGEGTSMRTPMKKKKMKK